MLRRGDAAAFAPPAAVTADAAAGTILLGELAAQEAGESPRECRQQAWGLCGEDSPGAARDGGPGDVHRPRRAQEKSKRAADRDRFLGLDEELVDRALWVRLGLGQGLGALVPGVLGGRARGATEASTRARRDQSGIAAGAAAPESCPFEGHGITLGSAAAGQALRQATASIGSAPQRVQLPYVPSGCTC